jgi:hypothetical protein
MPEPKFTPGPWQVGKGYGMENGIDGWTYYPIYYGTDTEQICDIVYNKADADLIAAAPDMYATLENVCMICQLRDQETNCECCQFGKVLKKARGEA